MNEAVAPAHHMKPMNCVHPIISSVSAGSCNAVAFARVNTESFRAFRGGGTPEPRWMCVCIMQRMTRTQREVNSGETSTAAGAPCVNTNSTTLAHTYGICPSNIEKFGMQSVCQRRCQCRNRNHYAIPNEAKLYLFVCAALRSVVRVYLTICWHVQYGRNGWLNE